MSAVRVLRKEELPTEVHGSGAPVWWAMMLVVAIETTVFATLISSYFYLRFSAPEWPPGDIPDPGLLLPVINTGVLVASSVAVYWGSSGIAKGDLRRLKWGFGIGVSMEAVFFVIKMVVSTGLGYGWTTHAYGSIFSTIDRLHSAHVVVAIILGTVAEVLAFRGYFSEERRLGVQAVNIYWQFVTVIWFPVFVVLFLVPRWF